MDSKQVFHLFPELFSEKEKVLLESPPFIASAFRFPSGVLGLRMANEQGVLVMLPFQGQQIWSAAFNNRNLTMKD